LSASGSMQPLCLNMHVVIMLTMYGESSKLRVLGWLQP